ncbi:MAG: response regulator [Polyangiales bacterium]
MPAGVLRESLARLRRPASFTAVPLRVGGRAMAALWLAAASSGRRSFRDDRLDAWHVPFLTLCQGSVERALENALLTRALGDANTQLRKTVLGLERAQEELVHARKMEAVGHLAGGVAHEFNNLLTVVLSYGAMLQELALPDPARVDLARMLDAATRASELTRQLLTLGRRQVLRREAVDLGGVVTAFVALMERLVGETITLTAQVSTNLPACLADRAQVEQVLMNLTLNARDAMPHGGAVVIAVRPATSRDLASIAQAAAPEGFIALEVTDEGVGMNAETRARIFEPFFTLKGEGRGTGLGLSVVYGIVAQSEGHITVESTPGRGARFTVFLPVAPARSMRPPVSVPAPAPRGRRGRLLIAEDEPLIRHVTVRALRAAGYDVCDAQDGEEALRLATRLDNIDALITDVVMPVMGGVELSERLRARRPELPVLFISGYSPTLLEGRRMERRSVSYLPKPFTPKQLLLELDALLGQPR